MTAFRETAEFKFGEEGEHLVARSLMNRGVLVSPVYQYTNHDAAPALFAAGRRPLVLPDLMCWKAGAFYFVEVKRKKRWVDFDESRGLETGFNARLFDHYHEVRLLTGSPLWVFFVHEVQRPTGVYAQEIAALAPHIRRWDGLHVANKRRVSTPLALFPLKVLVRICDRDALEKAA